MSAKALYQKCLVLGLTENKRDFSQRWLSRSPNYLTSLEAQNLDLSADALGQLYVQLAALHGHLDKAGNQPNSHWRSDKREQIGALVNDVQARLLERWRGNRL